MVYLALAAAWHVDKGRSCCRAQGVDGVLPGSSLVNKDGAQGSPPIFPDCAQVRCSFTQAIHRFVHNQGRNPDLRAGGSRPACTRGCRLLGGRAPEPSGVWYRWVERFPFGGAACCGGLVWWSKFRALCRSGWSAGRSPGDRERRAGMQTRSTVSPGWEWMVIVPPWRSTMMRCAISRPRPVPLPTSLVV